MNAVAASAPAVQVAHNAACEFIGNRNLDDHDRLQQRRLGLLHGFPERDAARGLERQFVGIHVVIGAPCRATKGAVRTGATMTEIYDLHAIRY